MKTEQEQLDFINSTCNTNYKSMDEVNWHYISEYQKLSKEFLCEFKDRINWGTFLNREDISDKIKLLINNYLINNYLIK